MNGTQIQKVAEEIFEKYSSLTTKKEILTQFALMDKELSDAEKFAEIEAKLQDAKSKLPAEDISSLQTIEEFENELIEVNEEEVVNLFANSKRFWNWDKLGATKKTPVEFALRIKEIKTGIKSPFSEDNTMWICDVYQPKGDGYLKNTYNIFPFQSLVTQYKNLGIRIGDLFRVVYSGMTEKPDSKGSFFHSCYVEKASKSDKK